MTRLVKLHPEAAALTARWRWLLGDVAPQTPLIPTTSRTSNRNDPFGQTPPKRCRTHYSSVCREIATTLRVLFPPGCIPRACRVSPGLYTPCMACFPRALYPVHVVFPPGSIPRACRVPLGLYTPCMSCFPGFNAGDGTPKSNWTHCFSVRREPVTTPSCFPRPLRRWCYTQSPCSLLAASPLAASSAWSDGSSLCSAGRRRNVLRSGTRPWPRSRRRWADRWQGSRGPCRAGWRQRPMSLRYTPLPARSGSRGRTV